MAEQGEQPDTSARITTAADEQFWRRVRQSWHRLSEVRAPHETPAPAARGELQELADAVEQLRAREAQLQWQNRQLNEAVTELMAERQRYRDLFEYAPDAYVVTDAQGIIHAANQAAAQLFSQTSDRLNGESLERFLPAAAELLQDSGAASNLDGEARTFDHDATVRARDGRDIAVGVRFARAETAEVRWLIRTAAR